MAVNNLDTMSPIARRLVIDSDGTRLSNGDCVLQKLLITLKKQATGAATLKVYNATTITGTPILTLVTDSNQSISVGHGATVQIDFTKGGKHGGLYLDTGLLLVTANPGEEFYVTPFGKTKGA